MAKTNRINNYQIIRQFIYTFIFLNSCFFYSISARAFLDCQSESSVNGTSDTTVNVFEATRSNPFNSVVLNITTADNNLLNYNILCNKSYSECGIDDGSNQIQPNANFKIQIKLSKISSTNDYRFELDFSDLDQGLVSFKKTLNCIKN